MARCRPVQREPLVLAEIVGADRLVEPVPRSQQVQHAATAAAPGDRRHVEGRRRRAAAEREVRAAPYAYLASTSRNAQYFAVGLPASSSGAS